MGVEARMKEIAKEKGMKTTQEIQEERLKKLNNEDHEAPLAPVYFYDLLNKKIVVVLLNNETIVGTLKSYNKYQLCLETNKIKALYVFKHAIKFYHEKNGGESTQ